MLYHFGILKICLQKAENDLWLRIWPQNGHFWCFWLAKSSEASCYDQFYWLESKKIWPPHLWSLKITRKGPGNERSIIFRVIKRFVCILIKTLGCKRRDETIVNLFQRTAARLPDKTMMTMCGELGDTTMTFRECLDKSVRIAHFFRNAGYVKVAPFQSIECSLTIEDS